MRLGVSALLLVSLSGAQWWILQSVAWSGMIVSYSAKSGLLRGVEETFDGDHPCPMCKAIKQARETGTDSPDTLAPVQKFTELQGLPPQVDYFFTRDLVASPAVTKLRARRLNVPPPVPPPRTLPA